MRRLQIDGSVRTVGCLVLVTVTALFVLMAKPVAWAHTVPNVGNQTLPPSLWLPHLEKRATPIKLTGSNAWNQLPAWSPDGTRIAFTNYKVATYSDIFVVEIGP